MDVDRCETVRGRTGAYATAQNGEIPRLVHFGVGKSGGARRKDKAVLCIFDGGTKSRRSWRINFAGVVIVCRFVRMPVAKSRGLLR